MGAPHGGIDPITGRTVFKRTAATNLNDAYDKWLLEGIIKFGDRDIDLDSEWSCRMPHVQTAFSVGHIILGNTLDAYLFSQKARDYLQSK